ncbi:MAG: hypothetical protein JXM70_14565 [Pirellulales bacterium]|nr:hypothetical protein [Pirellulales bacterium]
MQFPLTVIVAALSSLSAISALGGEVLYNGIELPSTWPPQIKEFRPADQTDPAVPPYLKNPPALIPIDVGRQLFVDDFLIESTTLKRSFHKLKPYEGNPILKPDKPWEAKGQWKEFHGPYAMPFSDGVWYDPQAKCFKMWYMGGLLYCTCYATSPDGLKWEKPKLDVVPGTNIVHTGNRDSSTVWLDPDEPDPQRRYKMFRFEKTPKWGLALHFSADGIHWSKEVRRAGHAYDRTTAFYNPFRKVWCFSIKGMFPKNQAPGAFQIRRYWEMPDLLNSSMWSGETGALLWVNTDRLDPRLEGFEGRRACIYDLDCVAYESLMLGLFALHQRYADREAGQPKKNEIFLGFSRDGFHWHRPLREPFVGVSKNRGDWNWGNVQPVGGCCLIVGDKLYFYYSGRAGSSRLPKQQSFWDADGSTGVGFLRRDGFASMDAEKNKGTLTTRPLTFRGKYLFVNSNTRGSLCVEVLDRKGAVVKGFDRNDCLPLHGDGTRQQVRWRNSQDLSALAGTPVRLRFVLNDGELYSFWVSPDASGASYGYVAAGGPGFSGSRDTGGKSK